MVYYQAVRRVARSGSSLIITLPKEIIDNFNIRKGDYVEVRLTPKKDLGVKYDDD